MQPVALITGAAQGIGRCLSLELSKQGYAIAAVDIDESGLRGLASAIPSCATATADVADLKALTAACRGLEAKLGPVELLVANAGIGRETSALAYDGETVNRVLAVNLLGVSNSIAAVLPGMLARRKGHLVALSSVASFRGLPRLWAYSASKAGVNVMMEGIRTEVAPLGIHVTTICPSWIRTAMTAPIQNRLPDILELDDGVRRILDAIQRKRRHAAFPGRTVWRLRFLCWLPRSWQDRLLARMSRQLRAE
jgi:NAD(P)-dependent dehydrogenase (short-subunit alcohol dehydrogenase family)